MAVKLLLRYICLLARCNEIEWGTTIAIYRSECACNDFQKCDSNSWVRLHWITPVALPPPPLPPTLAPISQQTLWTRLRAFVEEECTVRISAVPYRTFITLWINISCLSEYYSGELNHHGFCTKQQCMFPVAYAIFLPLIPALFSRSF